MDEPKNYTVAVVGNLTDNNPWDLEFWVRDDENARGSHAHWYRAGLGDDHPGVQYMSWERLQEHAKDRRLGDTLTVLGKATR